MNFCFDPLLYECTNDFKTGKTYRPSLTGKLVNNALILIEIFKTFRLKRLEIL